MTKSGRLKFFPFAERFRIKATLKRHTAFQRNLRGNLEEVTNDTWMARFVLQLQEIFGGDLNAAGDEPGKKGGYLAMNARIREAARKASEITGIDWKPAEVQETIWSFVKTLIEYSDNDDTARKNEYNNSKNKSGDGPVLRTLQEIFDSGEVTDDLIGDTVDFSLLFQEDKYRHILEDTGYGKELEQLKKNSGQPERSERWTVGDFGSDLFWDGTPGRRAIESTLVRLEEAKRRQHGNSDINGVISDLREDYGGTFDPSGPLRRDGAGTSRAYEVRSSRDAGGLWSLDIQLTDGEDKIPLNIKGIKYQAKGDVSTRLKFSSQKAPSFILLDKSTPENTRASAEAFTTAIEQAKKHNKYGVCVDVKKLSEYEKEGMKLFVSENGGAGFAITADGDLVSVFSNPKVEADKHSAFGTLMLAIQQGATHLDCYDTVLPIFYSKVGFKAVARVKWDERYTMVAGRELLSVKRGVQRRA